MSDSPLSVEKIANSSPLVFVRKGEDMDAGCNFCENIDSHWLLYSLHPDRRMHLRLCDLCAKQLVSMGK